MEKFYTESGISFDGCYDAGDVFYLSSNLFNGLLVYEKNNEILRFVSSFPGVDVWKTGLALHHKVYCYKEVLYFTPDDAGGIHTYDLRSAKMCFYPISNVKGRCIDSRRVGDKIWLFYAYAENPVVIFDVETKEIAYFEGIKDILPQEISERKSSAFMSVFSFCGDDAYGVIWDSCYVVHLNIASGRAEIVSLEGWAQRLSGVAYEDGILYLTELGTETVKTWNLTEGRGVVYQPDKPLGLSEKIAFVFSGVIAHGGQVLLLPNSGDVIYSLNHAKTTLEEYAHLPEGFADFEGLRAGWRRFFSYEFIDDKLRVYPARANMMLEIGLQEREVTGFAFCMEEEWEEMGFRLLMKPYMDKELLQGAFRESKKTDLTDFIKYAKGVK